MKRLIIFLFLILLIVSTYVIISPLNNIDQVTVIQTVSQDYWPDDTWRTSTPEEQGMDSGMLAGMINTISESGKSINSITIIRNGYLVNEAYFYPYQKGVKHALNSCTKSVISALVGIAIHDGKINSIEDKALDYFPGIELANIDEQKRNIKIKDLMTMSAGIKWDFTNNSSTVEMQQSEDWTGFYLNLPMAEKPGNTFNYCNGASHALASILKEATGKDPADLMAEKLHIGIGDIFWAISPEKVSSGYSGIYMQPDDMARFGYLYLRNGNWNGEQLIPENWVIESTKPQITANWGPLLPEYGYMWWINRSGGYAALGYGGQYIFVVPECDMVVVFTSGLFQGNDFFYPVELMGNYILPSVKSDKPLEMNKTVSGQLQKAVDMVQKAPTPQPVRSLPEIAGKVSGKTYNMDNGETLTFWFNGGDDFKVDINSGNQLKVGIDRDFRINDVGNIITGGLKDYHGAFRGRWLDENTLEIDFRVLEEGFETVYTASFEDDRIELKSKINLSDTETVVNGKLN
jgi:hypothetical protein